VIIETFFCAPEGGGWDLLLGATTGSALKWPFGALANSQHGGGALEVPVLVENTEHERHAAPAYDAVVHDHPNKAPRPATSAGPPRFLHER